MIKNIIFDWSGTLLNESEIGYEATMYVFDKCNTPRISFEEYKDEFVQPFMKFFNKFIPWLTIEEETKYFNDYRRFKKPELHANVKSTLEKLKNKGIKLAILSVNTDEILNIQVDYTGIRDFFLAVRSCEEDKLEALPPLLKELGFLPDETIFVGDTDHDVEAAKHAGTTSLALSWGTRSIKAIKASNPDFLSDNILTLLDIID
jgi:phosphoglycolate phosphatase